MQTVSLLWMGPIYNSKSTKWPGVWTGKNWGMILVLWYSTLVDAQVLYLYICIKYLNFMHLPDVALEASYQTTRRTTV